MHADDTIDMSLESWERHVPETVDASIYAAGTDEAGGALLRIDVPALAPVDFYRFTRPVEGAAPGETWAFSARVRTRDHTGGVGAFLSLAGLDAEGNRYVARESERVILTRDWTRVRAVLFVTSRTRLLQPGCFLHGTGRAEFADLRLERLSARARVAEAGSLAVRLSDEVTVPADQFLGFGFEDDAFFFTEENLGRGVTPAEVELREARIAELDPGVVATLLWWDAISPERRLDRIDYDNEQMRAFTRMLDTHQAAGRSVIVADVFWGWSAAEFPYNEANVERGVAIYLDLLRRLIIERGYECIRIVSIAGEIDMRWQLEFKGSVESYYRACRLLRAGLDKMGLEHIMTIGDTTGGPDWLTRIIESSDDAYSIYTIHEYLDVTQYPVIDVRLREATEAVRRHAAPAAPGPGGAPRTKPVFLWEIGFKDHEAGDNDNRMSAARRFEYGLWCANTCNAALNEGVVGGSVWCLQQMYYPGANFMDFGLWEFKDGQWRIRPAYYGYGLYTRFARPGLEAVRVHETPDCHDFSAAALRDQQGRTAALYLDNLSSEAVPVNIEGLTPQAYDVYRYTEAALPAPGSALYGRLEALRTGEPRRPGDGPLTVPARSLLLLLHRRP